LETFTSEELALAQRLLDLEGEPGVDAAVCATRVWERLSPQTANIFTGSGNAALLKRALYLAAQRFPALTSVGDQPPLRGLDVAVAGLYPAEAAEAVASLVATVLHLLITFIGYGLTMRILTGLWPAVRIAAFPAQDEEGRT
jgi:hypothetical protein